METEIDLIIKEGLGENGLVVDIRMGEEPDQKRLDTLITALEVVSEHADSWVNINKELAAALYALTFHLAGLVEGWNAQGKKWKSNVIDDFFPQIYEIVDEIFGV